MTLEMCMQFLTAFAGTVAFSVIFSVPKEYYPTCGLIGGCGWIVCWGCMNFFDINAIVSSFLATVFIGLASRFASSRQKCPVTLFLIAGIFPEVPGVGIYRTVYYTVMQDNYRSVYYGRQTVGIAVAMVLGIVLVFEIPQKTINRLAKKNR